MGNRIATILEDIVGDFHALQKERDMLYRYVHGFVNYRKEFMRPEQARKYLETLDAPLLDDPEFFSHEK